MDGRQLCRHAYRGRDKFGQWHYGAYLYWFSRQQIFSPDGEITEVDPDTVGRCTGLTDKTGAAIFEDDVMMDRNGCAFTVVWIDESASFGGLYLDVADAMDPFEVCQSEYFSGDWCGLERIGNIHDNPSFFEEGCFDEQCGEPTKKEEDQA